MKKGDIIKEYHVEFNPFREIICRQGIVLKEYDDIVLIQFDNYKESFMKSEIRNSRYTKIFKKVGNKWVNAKDDYKIAIKEQSKMLDINNTEGRQNYYQKTREGKEKRIVCIETGVIFKSNRECAEYNKTKRQYITRACQTGKPCTNIDLHFAYYDDYINGNYKVKEYQGNKKTRKQVIDIDTGEIWYSMGQCARDLDVCREQIVKVCKQNKGFVKGRKIRYKEVVDNDK